MINLVFILMGGLLIILASIFSLVKERNKFHYLSNYKQSRWLNHFKRFIRLNLKKTASVSKKDRFVIAAIGTLFAFTANNIFAVPKYLFWGLLLGLLLVKFVGDMKIKALRTKKLKEVSTLFEAVELYTKAGYTVYQALRSARLLTHIIRPNLDKCLEYWSSSPQKALETLQQELNLPESEILILLLTHMEVVGAKEMQGIIKREANNINRVEKMKNQISISNRPLILMVYRLLPLVSILGIAVGSLLYRTYTVLSQAGILF